MKRLLAAVGLAAVAGLGLILAACTDISQGPRENFLLDDPHDCYWRIEGEVKTPEGWDPDGPDKVFELRFSNVQGWWDSIWDSPDPLADIEWSKRGATPPTYDIWDYKVEGSYHCMGDPSQAFFKPLSYWMSYPPNNVEETEIMGYVREGEEMVLKDELWSTNPFATGANCHYARIMLTDYYSWVNANLDLTD